MTISLNVHNVAKPATSETSRSRSRLTIDDDDCVNGGGGDGDDYEDDDDDDDDDETNQAAMLLAFFSLFWGIIAVFSMAVS